MIPRMTEPEWKNFIVDVKGDVDISLPAERAVLSLVLTEKGNEKKKVTDNIVESARKVEKYLREGTAPKENQSAAIDYWSRTSLSETSHVPYDSERKINLPREYHASVNFDIRLQKFGVLGKTIHDLVEIDHVSSNGVQWVLTSETMEAQRSKLRAMAAKDAVHKAQDYAKAVGYDKVTPLSMKESQAYTRSSNRKGGLIPTDGVETQSKNRAEAEEWEDLGDEAFQYTPEEVKMVQSVDAKFLAEKD